MEKPDTITERTTGGEPVANPLPLAVRIMDDDTIEVYGVRYAGELFRVFGLAPIGTVLQIIARDNGTVTVRTLPPPAEGSADGPAK